MSRVIEALMHHKQRRPLASALCGHALCLSYAELYEYVRMLATDLRRLRARCVGVLADNGPAWAIADLAALHAGIPCLPIPLFFSPAQTAHALADAGVDLVLIDACLSAPLPGAEEVSRGLNPAARQMLRAWRLPLHAVALPPRTAKITYTSGTTGTPKGVCLNAEAQETVARSLVEASGSAAESRHLCALPLSTLLENIAGLYAPLIAGGCSFLLPLDEIGLRGASGFEPASLIKSAETNAATSVVLVPQMLQALVVAIERGAQRPASLRYVAVGGAPVSERLLQRAAAVGLPVYEGYGLSECASVVALNSVARTRRGSVGQPLPQLHLTIADDGEIVVRGRAFLGYVGEPPRELGEPVATGDLGHLDDDGFLHLTGRKKTIFITSFGRNVAPEWIERELCLHPAIAQAAVFGEAAPYNVAAIVPRAHDEGLLCSALAEINEELPDYARVRRHFLAHPFTPANGQATTNGRLHRAAIRAAYADQIRHLYEIEPE